MELILYVYIALVSICAFNYWLVYKLDTQIGAVEPINILSFKDAAYNCINPIICTAVVGFLIVKIIYNISSMVFHG